MLTLKKTIGQLTKGSTPRRL